MFYSFKARAVTGEEIIFDVRDCPRQFNTNNFILLGRPNSRVLICSTVVPTLKLKDKLGQDLYAGDIVVCEETKELLLLNVPWREHLTYTTMQPVSLDDKTLVKIKTIFDEATLQHISYFARMSLFHETVYLANDQTFRYRNIAMPSPGGLLCRTGSIPFTASSAIVKQGFPTQEGRIKWFGDGYILEDGKVIKEGS